MRTAYGLSRVEDFSGITPETAVQDLLASIYGDDVNLLDAYVGALAEKEQGSAMFAGPLLRVRHEKKNVDNDL